MAKKDKTSPSKSSDESKDSSTERTRSLLFSSKEITLVDLEEDSDSTLISQNTQNGPEAPRYLSEPDNASLSLGCVHIASVSIIARLPKP